MPRKENGGALTKFQPEWLLCHGVDQILRALDQLESKSSNDLRLIQSERILHISIEFFGESETLNG